MRKSEFRKARMERWRMDKAHDITLTLVERDLEAAEAAGVVWEPEEEPLPERLEMDGPSVRAADVVSCPYVADARTSYLGHREDTEPAERVLAEMVRRYNLLPEIEREAQAIMTAVDRDGFTWNRGSNILALLRGPKT